MPLYYCEICGNRVRATKIMKDRYESLEDPIIICQSCRYNLRVPEKLKCTRVTNSGKKCNSILFDRKISKCAGCRRRGYE